MVDKQFGITVCVPTFKRPELLARCLAGIASQSGVPVPYAVVVVDNDPEGSARIVVEEFANNSSVLARYIHEPRQNISIARNTAVANSDGNYIAFIDDDERPDSRWLSALFHTLVSYEADGVLGPVVPSYSGVPPEWLVDSRLCDRESFDTGTVIESSKHLRAGNLFLKASVFDGLETPFDPSLGRSGGEDADFLSRMVARELIFVWCEEATVFEEVPAERQTLRYHCQRAFIRGVTEADSEKFFSIGTLKSLVAVPAYSIALLILFVTSRPLFARYTVKWCDHAAKLLAQVGIMVVRERTF